MQEQTILRTRKLSVKCGQYTTASACLLWRSIAIGARTHTLLRPQRAVELLVNLAKAYVGDFKRYIFLLWLFVCFHEKFCIWSKATLNASQIPARLRTHVATRFKEERPSRTMLIILSIQIMHQAYSILIRRSAREVNSLGRRFVPRNVNCWITGWVCWALLSKTLVS